MIGALVIMFLAYLFGMMPAGAIATDSRHDDSHRMVGFIILWPLFLIKTLAKCVVAGALDLAGKYGTNA